MKYCVIDAEGNKVSRFFNNKSYAESIRTGDQGVISKKEAIEKGIFTESKRNPILRHMDISLVKGLTMGDTYKKEYANQINTKNYIDFCHKNGYIVPVMVKSLG